MRRLIVAPAWIGDIVMSHALLRWLKQQYPSDHLDILLPAHGVPLAQRMSGLSDYLVDPCVHGELGLKKRYALGRSLRGRYAQAIVLKNSLKSALIPFFAKIKCRSSWLGESRWGLINDIHPCRPQQYPMMVQRFLCLGVDRQQMIPDYRDYYPTLTVDHKNQAECLQRLSLNTDRPIVALCPGAAYGPAKRWPMQYFIELARMKIAQGYQLWVFGSAQEAGDVEALLQQCPEYSHNLCGYTDLKDAVDLLALAAVVVSNDSGLMHMAAALRRPLIAIYGSTSETFAPPLSAQASSLFLDLPCRPCRRRQCPYQHYQCLRGITAPEVSEKIEQVLQNSCVQSTVQ